METTRKQTDYYELVGEIDNNYYFLDYIFTDGDFKGATATVVRPVDADEYYDSNRLRDWCDELWRMAVADNNTDAGLDDWIEYSGISEDDMFDSDMNGKIWDKMRELYPDEEAWPTFEVVGGGRSFSKDMDWQTIYNRDLLNKIEEVEAQS